MRRKTLISFLLLFLGLMIMGVAAYADVLRLDQSIGWGRARIAALLLGVLFFFLAPSYYFLADKIVLALRKSSAFSNENRTVDQSVLARLGKYSFTLPFVAVVILIYVWLISSGTWTTWTSPTRYYADLARGFQNGKLYIPSRPPAELLTLDDPYDHKARARAGIQTPIDISYYNGRYYLYWGSVPALVLVAASPFYAGRIGDLQLVFVFVSGIFLVQVSLVVSIWDRSFQYLPKWLLIPSVLVMGLSSPVTYMLANYSGARIYEASITGAQFFLLAGFLTAFASLNGTFRAWKLLCAGILWSLAVGTRQTVLPAVGIMVLMLAVAILSRKSRLSEKIINMAVVALPLAIGLVCLGWYNWARFGSITESGLYYQMNYGYVHYHADKLFDFSYFFQNLYNYLAMPYGIAPQFPFLYPQLGSKEQILFSSPPIYNSQLITGLLWAAPFVVFAVIPSVILFYKKRSIQHDEKRLVDWVVLTLSGTSMVSFALLLVFFWAAMRYAYDFMPSLIMLSVIGFWQGYSLLLNRSVARKVYGVLGTVFASVSIGVSTLLAISINDARFELLRLLSSR